MPCFIIGHVGIFVSGFLLLGLGVVRGVIDGLSCAAVTYKKKSFFAGIRASMLFLRWFDVISNATAFQYPKGTCGGELSDYDRTDILGGNTMSLLDRRAMQEARRQEVDFAEDSRLFAQRRPSNGRPSTDATRRPSRIERQVSASVDLVTSRLLALNSVWESFFAGCQQALETSIRLGWCTYEDAEMYEPFLFIGAPSLVIFRVLERSTESRGIILLFDDGEKYEVTEETRPRGVFPDYVWNKMTLMRDMLKNLDLQVLTGRNKDAKEVFGEFHTALCWHASTCGGSSITAPGNEDMKVKTALILGGDRDEDIEYSGTAAIAAESLRKARRKRQEKLHKEAMDLLGGIQCLATDISRAPTFHRRFGDVLAKVVEEQKTGALGTKI